ncbi:MAG: HAMP domain-containing protein [archaeon]
MKATIFKKLLVIMLAITLVPLFILGLAALNDAKRLGLDATDAASSMGTEMVADTTASLNQLGVDVIKQKAIDVAKQLEIYIKANPTMTVADLQKDNYFSKIAVQPVGKTGYTAITDVATLICRFHSNPKIVNMDLANLAAKLPGFWSVMAPTKGGKVSEGFYDWTEADNSTKQKYMYISMVDAKTADGVQFSVAATTYIEEFSAPVVQTKEKIVASVASTEGQISNSVAKMQGTIVTIILLTIVFLIFVCFSFARSISKPIKQLKEAADKVTSGEFDVKLPSAKGTDEVAELTGSVEMLITAFKAKAQLPKKK